MTLRLRIYDENGSVSFSDEEIITASRNVQSSWFMAANQVSAQSLIPYSSTDGPAVAERTRNLLGENIPLWMRGHTDYASLKRSVNAIERLIEKANYGRTVWLEYNDGQSSDNLWRSPIVAGAFAMTNTTMLNLQENKAAMFASITRQPWWEGTKRAVNLGRTSVANATPISVLSTNNAGVMAAPIELTLTKTGGGTNGTRIYVFQKTNTESTVQTYNIGSTTTRAFAASNRDIATTVGTLSIGSLDEGWYRVWLGGLASSSMTSLRTSSVWRWAAGNASNYVDIGSWTQPGRIGSHQSRYTDLGSIYVGQRTHLHIQTYATADHTSSPQAVYLLPTDGYREFYVAGHFSNAGTLIDNGIDRTIGGTMAAVVQAHGEVLRLVPGEFSELVVLTEDSAGNVSNGYTIAGQYRPHRSTI